MNKWHQFDSKMRESGYEMQPPGAAANNLWLVSLWKKRNSTGTMSLFHTVRPCRLFVKHLSLIFRGNHYFPFLDSKMSKIIILSVLWISDCRYYNQTTHYWFCLSAQEVLPSWDRQVQNLCFQVNNVIEKINSHAPEWVAKYTESQMTSWRTSRSLQTE